MINTGDCEELFNRIADELGKDRCSGLNESLCLSTVIDIIYAYNDGMSIKQIANDYF